MAIRIEDFEDCEESGRYYGGDAGRKVGIGWHGSDWLLKFPGPTRHLEGSVPSHTPAPLSEWLGSHVYAMLGTPVHDTTLGIREGRLVCACRDFTQDGARLVEFRDLRNSLSDDEPGFVEAPSSGRGTVLADVRATIHRAPILTRIEGVHDRFWDMFVTDAFIRNIHRNNTNWGILTGAGRPPRLAPVYDNGSAFHNKRTPRQIHERLTDPDLLRQDALDVRSCYTDDRGKPIPPLKYIRSGQDEACTRALARFMARFDIDKFHTLLDEIPAQAYGVTIMDDEWREYHHLVADIRYRDAFEPMADRLSATHGTPDTGPDASPRPENAGTIQGPDIPGPMAIPPTPWQDAGIE